MTDLTFTHNTDDRRYEAWDAGTRAAVAAYENVGTLVEFTHTQVESAYEGKGVGSQLVRFALDDVRNEGNHKIVPICPFVKGWIARHPDYSDLVFHSSRERG